MNEKLKNAFGKLEKTRLDFISRIDELPEDQRSFKPSENDWSMVEVFEHIIIGETLILEYFKKNPPAQTQFKTTLKSKLAYGLLARLYKSATKVKVPIKGLDPKGEMSWSELKKQSSDNDHFFYSLLEKFPEEKLNYSVFKHPVSGPMTMQNTIDFFTNHMLHHLHQLNRLKKHVNFPKT